MVPVIASNGASFRGAFDYYFHDVKARTTARIAWTQTLNMLTDCVDKAWKVMAYTAKNQSRLKEASGQKATGNKLRKPVFAYSLSWHPEQTPDRETMLSAAKESLEKLGLSEHQIMIAAHRDQPQPHIHIVVNTVHPVSGLVADLKYTKRKLSDFAREFQRREGTNYCPKREENYKERQAGMETKYSDPAINEAWENAKNGEDFVAALRTHGYDLAQGRKRIVVVDPYGKTFNPTRHLPGVKVAELDKKLGRFADDRLPSVDEVIRDRKQSAVRARADAEYSHHTDAGPKSERGFDRSSEKINNIIARQQDRHDEEKATLIDQYIQNLSELREEYTNAQKQTKIETIEHRLERQSFWHRLFRFDRKLKKHHNTLVEELSKAKASLSTKELKLKKTFESDRHSLEEQHIRQQRKLIATLQKRLPKHDYVSTKATGNDLDRENGVLGRTTPDLSR